MCRSSAQPVGTAPPPVPVALPTPQSISFAPLAITALPVQPYLFSVKPVTTLSQLVPPNNQTVISVLLVSRAQAVLMSPTPPLLTTQCTVTPVTTVAPVQHQFSKPSAQEVTTVPLVPSLSTSAVKVPTSLTQDNNLAKHALSDTTVTALIQQLLPHVPRATTVPQELNTPTNTHALLVPTVLSQKVSSYQTALIATMVITANIKVKPPSPPRLFRDTTTMVWMLRQLLILTCVLKPCTVLRELTKLLLVLMVTGRRGVVPPLRTTASPAKEANGANSTSCPQMPPSSTGKRAIPRGPSLTLKLLKCPSGHGTV